LLVIFYYCWLLVASYFCRIVGYCVIVIFSLLLIICC